MKWPFGNRRAEPATVQETIPSVAEMRESLGPQASANPSWGGLSGDIWADIFGGGFSAAGQIVNADTAMKIGAVFACVQLISGAASCSPIQTYKRGEDRKEAPNHFLAPLLRLRPNRFMTASTFWTGFLSHKLLQGNGYANIVRDRWGTPVALYPLMPRNVAVYFAWELGLDGKLGVERNRLFYGVTFPDGAYKVFDQDDMLHVPNILSSDGKTGLSTVKAMAQAAGLALAAEESSAKFFENGMQFDKALKYDKQLSAEGLKLLREELDRRHSGTQNHHRPMILTEGGEFQQLTMSAADAQLLESRKFSVIDVCRFFGVPPVMIGETEKTSSWGSGVEQMGRWFTTFTVNKHFTAIEQELEVKLFRNDGHFAEFDESELTRGDLKARAEYYKAGLGSLQTPGWLKVNEVRKAELLSRVEDGDTLQKPVLKDGKGGSDAQQTDAPAA